MKKRNGILKLLQSIDYEDSIIGRLHAYVCVCVCTCVLMNVFYCTFSPHLFDNYNIPLAIKIWSFLLWL